MAEALLRAKVPVCEVSSAGVAALTGYPAAAYARQTMSAHGHDIANHSAQQATRANLATADLIIAVDHSHVEWITRNFPQFRGRVHKLGKWRDDIDVADPYGGSKDDFEEAYQLIDSCTNDWAPRLRN
jgi:protein-tyrosine phosphatase